jgi:hypothetical protein
MGKRLLMLAIVLAAPAIFGLVGQAALGQTRRAPPRSRGAASRATAAKGDGGGSEVPAAGTLAPTSTGTAPAVAPTATWDAGAVVESKTLDGGTHVFKFSELDIEGRLKSPQLVYFLRRVRAEFAAGELGHRSFMREMSETRKEGSFQ